MNLTSIKMFAAACLVAGTMSACGSDSTPTTNTTSTNTTIDGQAIAGAVTGNLTVRDASGAQVATASVHAGSFTVSIPNASLSQSLDFEITGTYRDEVSGQNVTLTATNPLALRVAANFYRAGQTGNAPITPDTSMIRAMVANGLALTAAETAFKNTFGYTPDLTAQPFDPYASQVTTQTMADQTAAFRVGIFSQLGTDLGLTAADLAELPHKLAADLADGTLDGLDSSSNPVTFSSGVNLQTKHQLMPLPNMLSMAVAGFAASPANVAGVAAPTMGLPPIAADTPGTTKTITLLDGTLVNIRLDVPNTAPFQMGFRNVKTTHQLTITNAATGVGIDITALGSPISAVNVKPWMYMFSGHGHPTPTGAVVNTTPVSGVYTIDVYYLMATAMIMADGSSVPMGQWDLNIAFTDTTGTAPTTTNAHFFPNVMMNMAPDLLLATGSNTNDQWTDMTGLTKPREYRVWLQDVVANTGGGHDIRIYATTLGMDMRIGGMIFPPVYQGFSVMMPPFSINTTLCEVSTDAGLTWTTMPMTATNGIYQILGLAGLTTGTASTLDIRLTVNGNIMQTAAGNHLQLSFTAP